MRRLMLFVLLAPAPLHAQQRAYDPAPLMAAAIKETMKPASNAAEIRETLRAHGIIVPEEVPRRYKLSRAFYSFERPERPDAPFTLPRAARAATENAALASAIATRLGLATTANGETEEKTCSPMPYPEGSSRAGSTYALCRYARTDAVVAASVPVVSGDTAFVDVMTWSNHSRATRGITFQVMEVTLVRTNHVWTAVSRRSIGTVDR